MIRFVPLDSGVIGLLCSSPSLANVAACISWARQLQQNGAILVFTDLCIYEVRRELIRVGATVKLGRLDQLIALYTHVPVGPEAWRKAAEFWALVRRTGKPTASPGTLDADAILAGVAATIGNPGDSVTIATTNVRHLSWFPGIDARRWEQIP